MQIQSPSDYSIKSVELPAVTVDSAGKGEIVERMSIQSEAGSEVKRKLSVKLSGKSKRVRFCRFKIIYQLKILPISISINHDMYM